MTAPVPADVLSRLKAVLGEGGWSQDPDRLAVAPAAGVETDPDVLAEWESARNSGQWRTFRTITGDSGPP